MEWAPTTSINRVRKPDPLSRPRPHGTFGDRGGSPRGAYNGEFQLASNKPIVFNGRDRIDAKRRAMDYWYRRHRLEGVTLRQFLLRCRLVDDKVITFYPPA